MKNCPDYLLGPSSSIFYFDETEFVRIPNDSIEQLMLLYGDKFFES